MKTLAKLFSASALLVAAAMPAQADIVLDSFDYVDAGGTPITVYPAYPAGFPTGTEAYFELQGIDTTEPLALYLSGLPVVATADYYLNQDPDSDTIKSKAVVTSGNGFLNFATPVGDDVSALTLTYSSAPLPLAALGEFFAVDILSLNLGNNNEGFDVTVTVTDAFLNVSTYTTSFNTAINSLTTILVSFADFVGSANFYAVTNATFTIESEGNGTDFVLSQIAVVPEPATLGVLGLGLMGLGLRRRKAAK